MPKKSGVKPLVKYEGLLSEFPQNVRQEMEKEMLNLIERFIGKKGKYNLPNPEYEFKIVMRQGALKDIMRHKGWKNYQQAANALGFTRQYLCMIAHGQSVSVEFIARLGVLMGNIQSGWWIAFELVPRGVKDPNHPQWNQAKYDGKVPYAEFSPSAELRKLDYPAETEDRRKK